MKPVKIMAVEKTWIGKYNLAIIHAPFEEFNSDYLQKFSINLAIANSVFQCIEDVEPSIKKLASIARFSYFSFPIKNDYLRMENELGFVDKYAFSRTKEFYIKSLNKYFTRVSFNVLESKLVREHSYSGLCKKFI